MTEQNNNTNDSEYNRPRRPAPDTISYLRSLPLDLDVAQLEIESFVAVEATTTTTATAENNSSSIEFPSTLAAALQALYEIRHELASLAGDEHAASVVETLCRISLPWSPTAAGLVLESVAPYTLHLATHRYGSHVLQTILQLAAASALRQQQSTNLDWTDLALHDDAPLLPTSLSADDKESMPGNNKAALLLLEDWMLQVATSLEAYAADLAVHICGSHVLRTILCWLGNVQQQQTLSFSPLTAEGHNNNNNNRRGKVKPKKKKRKAATSQIDNGNGPSSSAFASGSSSGSGEMISFVVGKSGGQSYERRTESLVRYTNALTIVPTATSLGPGDVQRWACHSSAGPVLSMLLLVWTYLENNGDEHATSLWRTRHAEWELSQTNSPDRHLCLARPEPYFLVNSTAHDIVKRILCWTTSEEKAKFGEDVFYGLAGEPRGSHCLETILRVSTDSVYSELLQVGKLTDSDIVRDYVQDNQGDSVSGVSNFVIQTVLQTLRNKEQAAAMLSALEPTLQYVLDPNRKRRGILWRMAEMVVAFDDDCQSKFLRLVTTAAASALLTSSTNVNTVAKLNKCIPFLINAHLPVQNGERVLLDVAGTRAVYHMLRFQPALCKDTIKGIMELTTEQIESLTKDALGSRCILDGILDGPIDDSVFSSALKRLLVKLQGRWVAVAVDRVGHHTVKKLFRALHDIKDKELLVTEMVDGKNRMTGNSMGRSVLDALEVRIYESRGQVEWSKLITSNDKKESWLKDLVEGDSSSKNRIDQTSAKRSRVTSSMEGIISAMSIPKKQQL